MNKPPLHRLHTFIPWMPGRLVLNPRHQEFEPRIFMSLDCGTCEMSFSPQAWSTPRLVKAIRASDEIIFKLLETPS